MSAFFSRATISRQRNLVDDWNQNHQIGTEVVWHKLINPNREPQKAVTRSAAWLMGGHTAMILVDNQSGGVALEGVVALSEYTT
jgi:hypothetical protein